MSPKTKRAISTTVLGLAIVLMLRGAYLDGREDRGAVPPGTSTPWQTAGYVLLATGIALLWVARDKKNSGRS